MDQVQEWLGNVGEWFRAEDVRTGAAVVAGTAVALGTAGWRLLRGGTKAPPERARVVVDAPAGEHVQVSVGQRHIV